MVVQPEEPDTEREVEIFAGEPDPEDPRVYSPEKIEKRAQVMALRLAGLSLSQIAQQMNVTPSAVRQMIDITLADQDRERVEAMREVENLRLDRMQQAVWADAISGDHKAIRTFLQISARRSKLNGLDAPVKIDLNLSVRKDMEVALAELERVVLGEVISVRSDDGGGDDEGYEGSEESGE
jgi:DNA-binding transcriptional MerR regulator